MGGRPLAASGKRHADLVRLLRERSLQFGSFTLASGRASSYYIDARRTTMSAHGLELIGPLGLATIREAGWVPDAVGGLTLGADPIAYAIAIASLSSPPAVDAFTVRKQTKGHGTGQRVEGCYQHGGRVVIVEDVLTTGRSALAAAQALRAEEAEVVGVLAMVDREEGGRATVEGAGFEIRIMVSLTELGLDASGEPR